MNTYELYTFKVTALAPLHIGSGNELLNEYDYAVRNGHTWRLNDSVILEANMPEDDPATADRLAMLPPGRLLHETDFNPSNPNRFFRYILPGKPRSELEGSQFREQIKDIYDKPYIPGSSFKGALRTALAWYGWRENEMAPSTEDLYEQSKNGEERAKAAKFVGQEYERQLFVGDRTPHGKEPNYDLLRALLVSDSKAVGQEHLMALNAQVFKHDGTPGTPIEVEAVQPKTVFEIPIKIDTSLFSNWAKKNGLDLPNAEWLRDLALAANEHSKARAETELNWLGDIAGTKRIASFYKKEILERALQKDQFLLQLGWGTGWENMTFGSHLQADEDFMETIIAEYKMSMNKDRQAGDVFPESRRMAIRTIQDDSIALIYPLGWVMVEMIKEK